LKPTALVGAVTGPHPAIATDLERVDFDFFMLDMEHGAFT